jgi:putative AlgH/UPF0301 family transcriptional regulator
MALSANECDWLTVQGEEHILLDSPHEHLVSLCTQHQLVFPPQDIVSHPFLLLIIDAFPFV